MEQVEQDMDDQARRAAKHLAILTVLVLVTFGVIHLLESHLSM